MSVQAATEEKASVILDSPDITPAPHPQAAPRSSHFSSDSAILSLSDMESDKRNSKSSLPPNSPAPDTMQHFAETYIAATKIWCAAAVRFARHLHDQDTKARSKRASLDLENNFAPQFECALTLRFEFERVMIRKILYLEVICCLPFRPILRFTGLGQ